MRTSDPRRSGLDWQALPRTAQIFVVGVIAAGAATVVLFWPREWPPLGMFIALTLASCLTSAWKVNLPIPLSSGSTLSMSYAADLTALLLLGPRAALLVALAGAWTQCTFNVKRTYPMYRTAFSVAAEAVTMVATGLVYTALGGRLAPFELNSLAEPIIGAITTYFVVNTGLVAAAIALSTQQSFLRIWREDFLWSVAGFMVGGSAGAGAAVIIARGQHWAAILAVMPVYLAYRTYSVFVGRLADERRHAEELERSQAETISALLQARQSEQALQDEKERLVVMLRSIGDGVIATDLEGRILLINNVAEALTGQSRNDAMGRRLPSIFQTVDPETRKRLDNSVRAVIDSAQGARRTSVLVARDLSERPIEECAAPLRDAAGRVIGMVLVFRDITDTLRVQDERARASRLSSLGLLAGGIAHDFNNILMSIMGNISMARATLPGVTAVGGPLADAEQACVRARQITWQLLTFSKGGVPHRKSVGITRVLEEAANLALRGSNVTCTFDFAPNLWMLEADETQLVQVFTNLLINAQHAMPHGGSVTVRAENVMEVTSRSEHALPVEPGRYVRVSVIDHGIGIPKEHLSRIFDPYFSTKQRGSGLGLATTYSIVKNHRGFISVDSQLGRGTTMDVHFPAAAVETQREALPPMVVSSPGDRRRVLVMDDEASNRRLAANMLEFLGYEVEVVDNGSAAIERFEHALDSGCPFDAVMLDLLVPGNLGGREAIDRIADLDPTVKAILVTGYAQDSEISTFRDYGFAAAMTKPFSLQELRSTLETVIAPAAWRVH